MYMYTGVPARLRAGRLQGSVKAPRDLRVKLAAHELQARHGPAQTREHVPVV
jgi:hypothetical protein